MKVFNIAKEFSRYPAGRYESDGDYSGEAFRKKVLNKLLEEHEKIRIEFDGARGYGSSFLEEAFGGLVRDGMSANDLLHRIEFESKDPSIVKEVEGYIVDAGAE